MPFNLINFEEQLLRYLESTDSNLINKMFINSFRLHEYTLPGRELKDTYQANSISRDELKNIPLVEPEDEGSSYHFVKVKKKDSKNGKSLEDITFKEFIAKKDKNLYSFVYAIDRDFDFIQSSKTSDMPPDEWLESLPQGQQMKYASNLNNWKVCIEEFNNQTYYVSNGFQKILKYLELLNKNGYLIITTGTRSEITEKGFNSTFENILSDRGFYINGIIGFQSRIAQIKKKEHFGKYCYVISKQKNDTLFLGDYHPSNHEYTSGNYGDAPQKEHLPLINKFFKGSKLPSQGATLSEGYFLPRKLYNSLRSELAKHEANESIKNYKNYKLLSLEDMAVEEILNFNLPSKTKKDNHIYILNKCIDKATYEVDIPVSKLNSDKGGLNSRYFCCQLKNNVNKKYINLFLNSKLGNLLFISLLESGNNDQIFRGKILTKEGLLNLPILLPSKEVQEEIVRADEKILKLQNSINEFKADLTINPEKLITEKINQIDDMLNQAGKLNDIDKIRALLRGEEKGDTEFKKSWRLPTEEIRKGETFEAVSNRISCLVFKVINSFINSFGGDLLIGIDDSTKNIVGLNSELDHFYKKISTLSKQKDMFDTLFTQRLMVAFKSTFIGSNNNITSKFVDIDGKCIYMISCLPGNEPCLLQDKKLVKELGNDFYIRKKANSFPLLGQERQDYIHTQFYSSDK